MRVCITIDTEFSIAGAFADPALLPVGLPMVSCDVDGKSEGLGFLLSCFARHGVQATFFVETLQRYYFREDPMRSVVQQITLHGHDVQLHLHPCWSVFQHPDWRQRVRQQPRQDDIAGRDPASMVALLRQGQATFREWGLAPPLAFRAGNLQYDDNLYRALAQVGIPYSSNVGLGLFDSGVASYQLASGRHLRHGVVECPVLSFDDWRSPAKLATVAGTSFAELRGLLELAHAQGMEQIVILTHPFEYVQRQRRHSVNQKRLERLCAWVAAHPDRYQFSSLTEAARQPLTSASSRNLLLRGRPWRTAGRLATQLLQVRGQRRHSDIGSRATQCPNVGVDPECCGSWRGAVRAWLALADMRAGRLTAFYLHRPQQVQRVVFVCLGNICRSAYAERVAVGLGMPAISIGLATTTGATSPQSAQLAARRAGEDLRLHRATDFRDYAPQAGDLLVAMEPRHARELQRRLHGRTDIQIVLLGLWCKPRMPHLHDPYTLSDAYFDCCFARIRQAVHALHLTLAPA